MDLTEFTITGGQDEVELVHRRCGERLGVPWAVITLSEALVDANRHRWECEKSQR